MQPLKQQTIRSLMRSNHIKILKRILSTFSLAAIMIFMSLFFTQPAAYAATLAKGNHPAGINPASPQTEIDPCLYVSIAYDNVSVVPLRLGVGQEYRVRLFIGNGCDHSIPAGGGQWSLVGKGTCDNGQTFLISSHYGSLPSLPAHSAPQVVDSTVHITWCDVYNNGVLVAQILPIHIEYFANASYTYKVGNITIELTGSADNRLY